MNDITLFIICCLISAFIGLAACFIASIFTPVQIALTAAIGVLIGLAILMILAFQEGKK